MIFSLKDLIRIVVKYFSSDVLANLFFWTYFVATEQQPQAFGISQTQMKNKLTCHNWLVNLHHPLGVFNRRQTDDVVLPQNTGSDISCKLSPNGGNLYEMTAPVFW